MSKNSFININPKTRDKSIKDENFSNTKKETLLLPSKNINESIYNSIKSSFKNSNNLSLTDKKLILIVLKSYEKTINNLNLEKSDFVLTKHEINEFLNLEKKNILRYVVYRYKYNIYPKLKIIDEYPPNIQIEPTSQCNLRCIMCYQSDKSFSSKSAGFMGYMKLDLLKKIVDEIEGKIEAVTFASRGEPTLHGELDEFLKYCDGKFLGLKLNTNATLLDEKKINSLLSSDLQSLVLSIDEKNKENYEKIRVNAKFEKIMKNLELLKNIREKNYKNSKLMIRISGVKINTEQNVEEMNQFYKEFADEIVLVDYDPWESAYENKINNIEDECSELYRRMFVWQDGKVNPCDYDYKSTLSQWNANKDDIKSIWNSKYYNEIRDLHRSKERSKIEPCRRCIST
jgi:radical SAM protein with 4Fe4S-binding SPASM domain|tara:strand:- start:3215 stop:4414 length:1200 start_codon:yes stop_codon:yes gene_type:complete